MTSGIEQYPHMLLRLELGHGGTQSNRFGRRRAQVPDLEVEVHHRPLLPLDRRPHRSLIALRAESRPVYLHLIGAEADSPIYRQIRRDWPGTLIANPRLPYPGQPPVDGGQAAGERLLAAGADLIALGRAFIANPDLVERIRVGAPLNPLRDGLMYVGGSTGYTDYPALGSSVAVERRNAVGSVTVG